jgi:hypothetical protein
MTTLKSTGKHNRQTRRKAGSEFAALAMKRDWGKWEDIDFEKTAILPIPKGLVRFYKNNLYTVQVYLADRGIKRALIRRNDETTKVSWRDKQRIKNELFGEGAIAVEVFPPESRLIDDANIYWLWVLPKDNYPFVV